MFCDLIMLWRVMIFGHPFDDNLVFLSSYWSKTMEREKWRERIRATCEEFFFPNPIAKKKFKSDPLWKKISKMTHFHFWFFFFVFFSIPAIWNGGTEPMADTCPTVTGWRDWTVFFFKFFFRSPRFDWRDWLFFFVFFGTTFIYN